MPSIFPPTAAEEIRLGGDANTIVCAPMRFSDMAVRPFLFARSLCAKEEKYVKGLGKAYKKEVYCL